MRKDFCRITVRDAGPAEVGERFAIEVKASYNEGWIETMKAQVPGVDRKYDADERRWHFTADYYEDLIELAVGHFDEATLVEGPVTTDLHTGRRVRQLGLFEGGRHD